MLKLNDVGVESKSIEREQKLWIISIQVMVHGKRWDKSTERVVHKTKRTASWGTSHRSIQAWQKEKLLLHLNRKQRDDRYDLNQSKTDPQIPKKHVRILFRLTNSSSSSSFVIIKWFNSEFCWAHSPLPRFTERYLKASCGSSRRYLFIRTMTNANAKCSAIANTAIANMNELVRLRWLIRTTKNGTQCVVEGVIQGGGLLDTAVSGYYMQALYYEKLSSPIKHVDYFRRAGYAVTSIHCFDRPSAEHSKIRKRFLVK